MFYSGVLKPADVIAAVNKASGSNSELGFAQFVEFMDMMEEKLLARLPAVSANSSMDTGVAVSGGNDSDEEEVSEEEKKQILLDCFNSLKSPNAEFVTLDALFEWSFIKKSFEKGDLDKAQLLKLVKKVTNRNTITQLTFDEFSRCLEEIPSELELDDLDSTSPIGYSSASSPALFPTNSKQKRDITIDPNARSLSFTEAARSTLNDFSNSNDNSPFQAIDAARSMFDHLKGNVSVFVPGSSRVYLSFTRLYVLFACLLACLFSEKIFVDIGCNELGWSADHHQQVTYYCPFC